MFVLPLSRSASRAAFAPSSTRAFSDPFDRFFGNAAVPTTSRNPALDVTETDTAYSVSFDVPGVTRAQLKVSVEGRRVSLESVDLAQPSDTPAAAGAPTPDAPRALYRERSAARYARTVSLPTEVDQTSSQAKFENGVLTLTLTKKVATGATQLNIG